MSYISKTKPTCKRTISEVKEFHSRKMTWLSDRLGKVRDDEFAVLYALVVIFLSNGSDWCNPKDKTLGEACGKSERTIQRITAGLKAAGQIGKQKQLGASHYSFTG